VPRPAASADRGFLSLVRPIDASVDAWLRALPEAVRREVGAWVARAGELGAAETECRAVIALASEARVELAVAWGDHALAHVVVEPGDLDGAVTFLERCVAPPRNEARMTRNAKAIVTQSGTPPRGNGLMGDFSADGIRMH
jgi:hypothetical protein